jgi:ubiquinol oxidase
MMSINRVPLNVQCGIQSPKYAHHKRTVTSTKIPKSFGCFLIDNVKGAINRKQLWVNDPYEHVTNREEKNEIRKFRKQINQLTLDDKAIVAREHARQQVKAPRFMMIVYYSICWGLDILYKDKPLDRFWLLETVARQPYFSYVAVLHMYETLGWWQIDGDLRRQHAHEEYNETMHLQIMESMGADRLWWNRFLARHGSIAYFAILFIFYLSSPTLAYKSSELLERHAVDTYDQFYEENEHVLKSMHLTDACIKYNPTARNMYDIFRSIANDENTHADNMMLNQNTKS